MFLFILFQHFTLLCWKSFEEITFTRSKSALETLEKGEICSKLTIKTPERRQLRLSGIFIVNFELFYTFF